MTGFITLHRGWRDNPIFNDREFSRGDAWIWLIENACWKPTRVRIKGDTVTLDRGELSYSVRYIADAWGWSKSRVDRFFDALRDEGMIETRSKNGTTADHKAGQGQSIISICNYGKYQDIDSDERDNSGTETGTTAGQQRDNSGTNKNKGTREQREPDGSHTPQSPPAENATSPDSAATQGGKQPPKRRPARGRQPLYVCERPADVSDQVWADFVRLRERLDADVTDTVIAMFRREAEGVGWPLERAISESVFRGWRGFRAKWIENDERSKNSWSGSSQRTDGRSALSRAIDEARDNL